MKCSTCTHEIENLYSLLLSAVLAKVEKYEEKKNITELRDSNI